ncbi:SpoIID/LytB domain-containing protein [Synechococcus sp. H55.10]|uniref:SpoIID/LytB domain-containing protein n=1 Tax=Synechococcus sp. H55.10 TaxID=2964503 RepID=UPI0039C6C270
MRRRQLAVMGLGSLWALWGGSLQAQTAGDWLAVELFSRWGAEPLTQLELSGPFVLNQQPFPAGIWKLQVHRQELVLSGPGQPRRYRGSLWLQGGGLRPVGGEERRYRGLIQIRPSGPEHLHLLNWVQLEDYLLALVPGEMPANWPAAALQAQAILARTLAVPHLRPAPRREWPSTPARPLQDSTAHQFYGGLAYETAATTAAVRATQGQILTHAGQPVEVLFHSTCGGHTSANQDIFAPPARPYLQGVSCEGCRASPFYGPHSVRLSRQELEQALGSAELEILQSDPWGRPLRIRVGSRLFTGQEFVLHLGQTLGWGILPSNRFTLKRLEPKAGQPESYLFTYRGAGHGVGLCQWGARGLAEQGYTASPILNHYFPGTQVTPLS